MKILNYMLIVLALILNLTVCHAQGGYATYDNSNGTSMMPIYKLTEKMIEVVENKNMEIVRIEFDLVHATSSSTTWRTLYQGISYGLMAYGDYRVKDLDMVVSIYKGGKWVEVSKDKATDSLAIVSVEPSETAEYKIEISVYEFHEGYSAAHYGLLVFR